MMPTAADIIAAARTWIGVRYRHQGRDRNGVDCAGLVLCVAKELGLTDFDTKDYDRRIINGMALRKLCDEHMCAVERPTPGGVLLMRFCVYPQHLAFVAEHCHGGLSLIHAYAQVRRVVEHALDAVWERRIVYAYRIEGVS